MVDAEEAVRAFSDACIRCGLCARTDCGNFPEGTPNLGDVCTSLLAGEGEWQHFPFTCALCNRCTVRCPAGLRAADACKPLRGMLMPQLPELHANYRHFRTDLKYNLFSLLRARRLGFLEDVVPVEGEAGLGEDADRTAFFPGCSLFSYAPALVDEASAWLRREGIAAFTLYFCCGSTFYDVGFFDEFAAYKEKVQAFLRERGITRIVATCPHCNHVLPDLLEGTGIELLKLPQLMAERGLEAPDTCRVSFHDACYDRHDGQFGASARELFAHARLVALGHERENTMCCGGGGMVSAYAPAYCEYRRVMRLQEIDDAQTDEVISTCFSCVNSMQRSVGSTPVRHYLEAVFGIDVDWQQVYASVDELYADPKAQELLKTDTPLFE